MTHAQHTSALAAFIATIILAAPAHVAAQSPPPQSVRIDATTRDSVINGVLAALDRSYVFPEKALEMRKAILAQRAAGAYANISSGPELAAVLTKHLQDVSHDKHLALRYPAMAPIAAIERGLSNRGLFEAPSCSMCGSEILPGNVGYVEIRSFGFPPDEGAEAVARAMTIVADADALIIDVRRNGGGSPDAVRLVSSYFFGEEPVLLNSLYWRPTDRMDHFYTFPTVAGKRYGPEKPVYVLTSQRTFSAAEEFAYNLQSRKRAIVVGEATGGGAHPGSMQRIGAFMLFVPSGRAINPVTKANWEGTGVRPDITVAADSALSAALRDARRKKPLDSSSIR